MPSPCCRRSPRSASDVGSVGYGWLRAAPGIGAVIVTAVLAARPVRRHVGRTLLVAVAVFGAATVVLGITHSYALAFVALIVLAGADAVSVFIRATIVPLATPDDMRGRVMAVENVFIGASNELGAFESGVAGAVLGVGPAVWVGGVLTVGVVGMSSVVFPQLRDIDRFEDLDGDDEDVASRRRPVWLTRAVRRRARRATSSADLGGTVKKYIDEFKEFINKGDVIMIAVGLVMALYFKAIVDAVLAGVINPIIAAIFGKASLRRHRLRHRRRADLDRSRDQRPHQLPRRRVVPVPRRQGVQQLQAPAARSAG